MDNNGMESFDDHSVTLANELIEAVESGEEQEVRRLVSIGASLNPFDFLGRTLLHFAGSGSVVRALISLGLRLDSKDNEGRTSLHYAVVRGDCEVISALIAAGADVNVADNNGDIPLHSASSADAAGVLVKAGSDVNRANNKGMTPLHHAVLMQRKGVAVVLLDGGADEHRVTASGKTTMDLYKEGEALVQFLKKLSGG